MPKQPKWSWTDEAGTFPPGVLDKLMGTNKTVYTKVLTLLQQHEDLPQEEQERKRIVPQLIEAFGAWHEILPVPEVEGKRQFLRLGLRSPNLEIRDWTIALMDGWECVADVLDILQQHHETEDYLADYVAKLVNEVNQEKQMPHNVVQDNYGALDGMWREHPDIAAEETALAEIAAKLIAAKLAAAPVVPNEQVDHVLLTQVLADDLTVKQLARLAHDLGLSVTFSFEPKK